MFSIRYRYHHHQNLKLGLPIVLGQLASIAIIVADTLMVGNYSNLALAASSAAGSVFFFIMNFGTGLAFGLKPLATTAVVTEKHEEMSHLLRHSVLMYCFWGLFMYGLFEIGKGGLVHLHLTPDVHQEMLPYLRLLMLSAPFWTLFLGLSQFCEALKYTQFPMYANIIGNVTNIGLNYILIFGKLDFPAMGLEGAGIATLIARVVMLLFIVGAILWEKELRKYVWLTSWTNWHWEFFRKLLKIGSPIGLQLVFETGAFAVSAIIAGQINSVSIAAHQIVLNLSVVSYLIAAGLSQGTTVHIADQLGRGLNKEVRYASKSAFFIVSIFMLSCAVIFIAGRNILPTFYLSATDADTPKVIALTASLMFIAAIYQISDGVQVIALGILRGMQDVKIPTTITLIAYWVIGIPVSYGLGIVLKMGVFGIWIGIWSGLSVAALSLCIRVFQKTKQLTP